MTRVKDEPDGCDWTLDLTQISAYCPALTPSCLQTLAEAASVCLEEQGHPLSVRIALSGFVKGYAHVIRGEVTDQIRRTYADPGEATEWGACAIAIGLIRVLTPSAVISRSYVGTGCDYWIGQGDPIPFHRQARLEVSGIRSSNGAEVRKRMKLKINQLKVTDGSYPAYIVIVLFSTPEAHMVKL